MRVSSQPFGEIDGVGIHRHVVENDVGIRLAVLDLGARVCRLDMPDAAGRAENVVLAAPDLSAYRADPWYLGAIVGRYANRLTVGGIPIVHGGASGFHDRRWAGTIEHDAEHASIRLRHTSPAGEGGFPGTLDVEAVYTVPADETRVSLDIRATSDADTPVNLTTHAFFCLDGPARGILDHELTVYADHVLDTDAELVPTGGLSAIAGTDLDFRSRRRLRDVVTSLDPRLRSTQGLDHTYALRGGEHELRRAARVTGTHSGRALEVWTTEPALDVYMGTLFDGSTTDASGAPHSRYAGLALEPGHFSDSPRFPYFATTQLRRGDEYLSRTEWRFGLAE